MRLAVLPGDDVGPEITDATIEVLRTAENVFGLAIDYEEHEVGMAAHRRVGTTLPDDAIAACRNADAVLLGPAGMTMYPPERDGGINIPGTIRKTLGLYANLRPSRSRAGIPKAVPGLDCLVVRENTQGFYADRNLYEGYGEFRPTADEALSLRLITRSASERIARVAFEQARLRRSHVTIVGKRHVLKVSDGLFVEAAQNVHQAFQDVELVEMDIDAMAADLYSRPEKFDVILTTNMFGDILSNEASSLAGGLGLAGALNVGDGHAAANAGHGSAPDIAGAGVANPTGLMISAGLLLGWWGERSSMPSFAAAGAAVLAAIDQVLADQSLRTADLGGTSSTKEFAAAVAARVK